MEDFEHVKVNIYTRVPTQDVPLTALPPEGIAAVRRKVDWSVSLQRNEEKYQKEMIFLLPPEYREWDPQRMCFYLLFFLFGLFGL